MHIPVELSFPKSRIFGNDTSYSEELAEERLHDHAGSCFQQSGSCDRWMLWMMAIQIGCARTYSSVTIGL